MLPSPFSRPAGWDPSSNRPYLKGTLYLVVLVFAASDKVLDTQPQTGADEPHLCRNLACFQVGTALRLDPSGIERYVFVRIEIIAQLIHDARTISCLLSSPDMSEFIATYEYLPFPLCSSDRPELQSHSPSAIKSRHTYLNCWILESEHTSFPSFFLCAPFSTTNHSGIRDLRMGRWAVADKDFRGGLES